MTEPQEDHNFCLWTWQGMPCALTRAHPSPHHIVGEQPQFDAVLARLHEVEAELQDCIIESKAMDDTAIRLGERLHEVEAERDAVTRGMLDVGGIVIAERDAALANAITPQQRAVLAAAVAWRQRLWHPTTLAAAVDALIEPER